MDAGMLEYRVNNIVIRTAAKMSEKMPPQQLSGVMIVIIISGGVLTFVMLFIFAKRQITRFTLRNRRGPHVPVGNDAKKAVRREIERRLDCIPKIRQEPKLLWDDDKYILQPDKPLAPYYYRMQAVDDVKILEQEIEKNDGSVRAAYDSLRAFLITTLGTATTSAAQIGSSQQRSIHQFCDMYEHARHDPAEFGSEEYEAYHRLLLKLLEIAKQLKIAPNSRKTSPARTPRKQQAKQTTSLLDPTRLRAPTVATVTAPPHGEHASGQHSKLNLTLGLPATTDLSATHNIHLQPTSERDTILRNRMNINTDQPEQPAVRHSSNLSLRDVELEDNEIMNISSLQLKGNSSVA